MVGFPKIGFGSPWQEEEIPGLGSPVKTGKLKLSHPNMFCFFIPGLSPFRLPLIFEYI